MDNIQKAMHLLESSLTEPDQRFPMSFEHFIMALFREPRRGHPQCIPNISRYDPFLCRGKRG
jgi:hypothetical protein